MDNVSRRPYVSCPLIDNFHVRNILGARERRQLMFGSNVQITTGASRNLTLSALTGGYIKSQYYSGLSVDHYQVLVQELNASPTIIPYTDRKSSVGFTLHGDNAAWFSVVLLVTLPQHPRATPKDAQYYDPYCKHYGFKDIVGSPVRDIAIFSGVMTCSGATVAVTFGPTAIHGACLTSPARKSSGYDGNVASPAIYFSQGSLPPALITQMAGTIVTGVPAYQIIVNRSTYTAGGALNYPYPSSITNAGFTLNGLTSGEYYDIMLFGQVESYTNEPSTTASAY